MLKSFESHLSLTLMQVKLVKMNPISEIWSSSLGGQIILERFLSNLKKLVKYLLFYYRIFCPEAVKMVFSWWECPAADKTFFVNGRLAIFTAMFHTWYSPSLILDFGGLVPLMACDTQLCTYSLFAFFSSKHHSLGSFNSGIVWKIKWVRIGVSSGSKCQLNINFEQASSLSRTYNF